MKGRVFPFEIPGVLKLNTICAQQKKECIIRRTHWEAAGNKELIARMEIKDYKQTFLDRPTDNKIDIYVEQNLKFRANHQDAQSK
jgi:hypothetical protein